MSIERHAEHNRGADDNSTRSALQQEAQKVRQTTDLDGHACRRQPSKDQFPVLELGQAGGCTFRKTDGKEPSTTKPAAALDLNTAELYNKAKDETVHVNIKAAHGRDTVPGSGSGVIIGKVGDKILIATDNHVANPPVDGTGLTIKDRSITMSDGSEHEAKVELSDPAHDMAVISIDARSVPPGSYHVASFAESPQKDGTGAVFGFPMDSKSLYASPGTFAGEKKSGDLYKSKSERLPGDDPDRSLTLIRAHSEEGDSGGPTYNGEGKVVGLLEGGPVKGKNVGRLSYVNPLTRNQVDDWIKRIRNES